MSFAEKFASKKQPTGSFASRILQQRALVYVFTIHVDNERWAWYVFEVEKPKRQAFEDLFFKTDGACDLKQFGTIHASGWGEEVPPQIQTEIRERFGIFAEE